MSEQLRQRVEKLLELVRYKDGWHFVAHMDLAGRVYVQAHFMTKCALTGEVGECGGRKWTLSPHATDSEIVQTAFAACLMAEEHEAREFFRFDGAQIFGPHLDVHALAAAIKLGSLPNDVRS